MIKIGINVLSLCDGMSGGQIALKEIGIKVDNYFASEIDKNAIKVTQDNFPNTIQLGNVMDFTYNEMADKDIVLNEDKLKKFPKIDLVIFGSPCRSLSKATAGRKDYNNGLKGISWLFYPCSAILQWVKENNNPDVKFMVENVDSNNKTDLQEITDCLGVKPILIDSGLFSAQTRLRNYWTNIPIATLPTSNPLVLEDIMDINVPQEYFYDKEFDYHGDDKKVCATLHINGHDILKRVNNKKFKSPTLTSCRGGNLQKKVFDNGRCRKLTPDEYRKLQTIPDWYKMNVAKSHIYNMCGDGWTIEVVKHIFKGLINT
jgi:site-specific DNA-cytosine methylase